MISERTQTSGDSDSLFIVQEQTVFYLLPEKEKKLENNNIKIVFNKGFKKRLKQ